MTKIIAIILLSLIVQISWVSGELIKPEDDSELTYIHVLFEWDDINGATGYDFQLSLNNDLLPVSQLSTLRNRIILKKILLSGNHNISGECGQ